MAGLQRWWRAEVQGPGPGLMSRRSRWRLCLSWSGGGAVGGDGDLELFGVRVQLRIVYAERAGRCAGVWIRCRVGHLLDM